MLPLSSASCIVVVGQVSQRAAVRDGEVVARPILPLSATFDHRIADAHHAATLVRARRYLEHPELL
jgi:pyruvate dehydrogenase E2 component (dihydrolipoamide acetyltransferase)